MNAGKKPLYRDHFCWPNESLPVGRTLAEMTGPSAWLAPKNSQLHRCQRCGYFVWRAPSGTSEETEQ